MSDDQGRCDCCGAEGVALREVEHLSAKYRFDNPDEKFLICDLCLGSLAFNAMCFHYGDAGLYQTVCFVGNEILKRLRSAP